MGKGGGGSAPQTSTVNQSNLPEYARPYFEDLMSRGQTASQVQYQPYQGERVAGFNPMQEQAFQGVQNLGPSPLLQPAAGLTGASGLGGLFAGQQYQQMATDPGATAAYMSPYMHNLVDFQKNQAIKDYGRQLPGQQAAATRAGAFGGSRQAIVESEAQRNLQNQLAGIQAQGTQSAFDAARQAQQFGSQLGLQGLGLAGQMGQQFGALGQTAFGQQAGAAQAQQQAGAIQQAQEQQRKDLAYEEFMRQTTYPQSQLQFYSSLLRGVPVAPQQTMYQYQAPPSMASQIGGLGLGALGLSKAFGAKDGGEVPGYADGGVTGEGGLASNVSKMVKLLMASQSPERDIMKIGGTRLEKALALEKVRQMRGAAQNQAALQGGEPQGTVLDEAGLAGLDVDMDYANGGIVAFQYGGSSMGAELGEIEPVEPQRQPTPEEVDAIIAARRARGETLGIGQILDIQSGKLGLPAALPQAAPVPTPTAAPAVTPQPGAPKPPAPALRPAARPAAPIPAETTPAPAAADTKLIPLQDVDKKEKEYRDYMGKKYSSELQDRLADLKEQGAQALKERDADRWLAVAMGGFAAAAGSSPYAFKNFAEGLGLTTKELSTINKDFRKANDALKKAEREERRADRLEQMGLDDKAYQVRQNADNFNLQAQKANQDYKYHIESTKAFRERTQATKEVGMAGVAATQAGTAEARATRTQAAQDANAVRRAEVYRKTREDVISENQLYATLNRKVREGKATKAEFDQLQNLKRDIETQINKVMAVSGYGAAAPQAGQVQDGYRFKGGNPADPNSWEKI